MTISWMGTVIEMWWREGYEVYHELTQAWKFCLVRGMVVTDEEGEGDCVDEQMWAIREGLA